MVKLNKDLKGQYAVTKKVIATRFEHRYLGKIDLERIGIPMARKLVVSGHLKQVKPTKVQKHKEQEIQEEPDQDKA
jgi:hypothetical protein